jgi:hypothetical protein
MKSVGNVTAEQVVAGLLKIIEARASCDNNGNVFSVEVVQAL